MIVRRRYSLTSRHYSLVVTDVVCFDLAELPVVELAEHFDEIAPADVELAVLDAEHFDSTDESELPAAELAETSSAQTYSAQASLILAFSVQAFSILAFSAQAFSRLISSCENQPVSLMTFVDHLNAASLIESHSQVIDHHLNLALSD